MYNNLFCLKIGRRFRIRNVFSDVLKSFMLPFLAPKVLSE